MLQLLAILFLQRRSFREEGSSALEFFSSMPVIGVLALQGAFREHIAAFSALGSDITAVEVRTPAELAACDGLVIPGGESTAMALIAQRTGMVRVLFRFVLSCLVHLSRSLDTVGTAQVMGPRGTAHVGHLRWHDNDG